MNNEVINCKRFEKFLRLVTKTNILAVQRKRFTWMVSYKNAEGQLSQVYWQFSLKEPWLKYHISTMEHPVPGLVCYRCTDGCFSILERHTSIDLTENGESPFEAWLRVRSTSYQKNNYSPLMPAEHAGIFFVFSYENSAY